MENDFELYCKKGKYNARLTGRFNFIIYPNKRDFLVKDTYFENGQIYEYNPNGNLSLSVLHNLYSKDDVTF